MDISDSDSDFDGLPRENDDETTEKDRRRDMREEESQEFDDESDIDVSEVDSDDLESDSEESSKESNGDDEIVNADWSTDLHEFKLPNFTVKSGPAHHLPTNAKPLDYFFLFLPQSFFDNMAIETNRYAQQKIEDREDRTWRPTNAAEMRAYIGINIMMGINPQPRIWCFWSTDMIFGNSFIKQIMPETRFLKLNQYFHLRDTSDTPGRDYPRYDPLFKIRPMLDDMVSKCLSTYIPGREVSVGEAIVGCKEKSTKFKVWELRESSTGYCSNFVVNTGKKRDEAGRQVRQHDLRYDVVWEMSKPFHNQNYHLYYDRYFSSVILSEHLEAVSTFTCGTIMANRKGLPPDVKNIKLKNQGDLVQFQRGRLLTTVYKDKRQLTFLSTSQLPFIDGGQVTMNLAYNKHMADVGKSDQHRVYYEVGRSGKKWWRHLVWYVINLSMVNAFIVFSQSKKDRPPPKGYDHLRFRVDVMEQLIAGCTYRKFKVARRSKQLDQPVHLDSINHHKLVHVFGRKKVCRECARQKRKTRSGRPVETSFQCSFCDVPLCRIRCFGTFHDRNLTS